MHATQVKLNEMRQQSFVPWYVKMLKKVSAPGMTALAIGDIINVQVRNESDQKNGNRNVTVFAVDKKDDKFVELQPDEYEVHLWVFQPRRTS
jgi:hypothetical protein